MEEKRLQLFFNFGLETCLTSRDWSTGRPTRAVGKKIFWKNFFGKFSQFNFSRLKLNENGLKWKKVRKETEIIFQFWFRNMSNKVGRMNWKTRQSVVGRKTFRSITLYHTIRLPLPACSRPPPPPPLSDFHISESLGWHLLRCPCNPEDNYN